MAFESCSAFVVWEHPVQWVVLGADLGLYSTGAYNNTLPQFQLAEFQNVPRYPWGEGTTLI